MTDTTVRLDEDQPFPGMPEHDPNTLWAVHIEGPDDLIPAVDRAEADTRANEINAAYEAFKKRPDFSPEHDARWRANVVPWPYGSTSHEELVADTGRWSA